MNRQFRHLYTVRYDESDSYGFLTPAACIRYMQDVAALDAEDAQLSGSGYWVVKRSVLSFNAPVPVHTRLELKTFGIAFTRITAQRGYEACIVGAEHNLPVISAHSLWVYLDTRGRPTRLPEQTAQIWLPDGPLPLQPDPSWEAFPQNAPYRAEYLVSFSDIDSMKHMNNAAYVEALDNAAWEACKEATILPDTATISVLEYAIEYAESARFGELLEIQTVFDPFPSVGKEFTRMQQIKREGVVLVRAQSRWLWQE